MPRKSTKSIGRFGTADCTDRSRSVDDTPEIVVQVGTRKLSGKPADLPYVAKAWLWLARAVLVAANDFADRNSSSTERDRDDVPFMHLRPEAPPVANELADRLVRPVGQLRGRSEPCAVLIIARFVGGVPDLVGADRDEVVFHHRLLDERVIPCAEAPGTGTVTGVGHARHPTVCLRAGVRPSSRRAAGCECVQGQ